MTQVTDSQHINMRDLFLVKLKNKIDARKKFYVALSELDNDPMTKTPFKLSELEDYKTGTDLLETTLEMFKTTFEVK